ncbi:hypothetical protein RCH16_002409 [Cryobacterium sp. MP_M5]|uniref:hypothetical protein n=1 Tax=unclassified Cryobacterium TaxID=2649013 RepID=UPI0018CB84F8|nr:MULTISPECIES: hypothetical protein [unclassified Cryobacterium]MBG6059102.1 hypothetical protein [Cryobacterium sp. MP_M3]MEC5177396.1 hypothetical protein [Cryobacterium sp. MP_M5]
MTGVDAAGRSVPGGEGGSSSADLIVSGGGSLVATDVLLAEAVTLRALQSAAGGWRERLERIRVLDSEPVPAPQWSGNDVGMSVFEAERAVHEVGERSGALADALVCAAEGYGRAERSAEYLGGLGGVWLGYLVGRVAPFLALSAVPALTAGAVGWFLGSLLAGSRPGAAPEAAARWFAENPRALTNPVLPAVLRVLVSSVDDGAAGVATVPFPVSFALGDQGAGLLGVTTSAAGVLAVARPLGLLRETGVTVDRVGRPAPVRPPAGFRELAARIPASAAGGAQVRVERYGPAGAAAWVVYSGGTAEWSPGVTAEPWDLSSNVAAVAEQGAGSYRAVVEAMREAGVRPADPVVQVGHSQGGLVASQVAASGQFNTVMIATFGAPNGQVEVPAGLAAVAVEHADDIVPALGGIGARAEERLVVRREVFATEPVRADLALPAHALTAYRETARLMDASPEPRLREFRSALGTVLGGEPGSMSRWRGVRAPGK